MIDWSQMLPVLIGGGLAIGGGIIGHIIAFKLDQKKEDRNLLRKKAEELVFAIHQYSAWLEEKQSCLFRETSHDTPSPISHAHMIQRLYFPSVRESLYQIQKASMPLIEFLNKQRIEQMRNKDKWMAEWDAEDFYSAYGEYLRTVSNITDEIRQKIGGING